MKILLLLSIFLSSIFSQTILCYKNNISDANIDKTIELDGQSCNGKLTINDMEEIGWELDDSKIIKNSSLKYNHIYILKKDTTVSYKKELEIKQINKLDLNMESFRIINVKQNQATINKGNMTIGQSGIIIHKYNNGNTIILSTAIVQSTSKDTSTLKFTHNHNILEQKALPATSRQVQNDDIFIVNHLYNSSLLITPNYAASQEIKSIYPKQNFLNPDIFAAHLKISNTPVPTQQDIYKFCKAQDIGTIYVAIETKFYILDVNSFKILKTTNLNIDDETTQTPFFTKVEDIKKNFWEYKKADQIKDYNSFYLALINNTTYSPKEIINKNEDDDQSFFSKLEKILAW